MWQREKRGESKTWPKMCDADLDVCCQLLNPKFYSHFGQTQVCLLRIIEIIYVLRFSHEVINSRNVFYRFVRIPNTNVSIIDEAHTANVAYWERIYPQFIALYVSSSSKQHQHWIMHQQWYKSDTIRKSHVRYYAYWASFNRLKTYSCINWFVCGLVNDDASLALFRCVAHSFLHSASFCSLKSRTAAVDDVRCVHCAGTLQTCVKRQFVFFRTETSFTFRTSFVSLLLLISFYHRILHRHPHIIDMDRKKFPRCGIALIVIDKTLRQTERENETKKKIRIYMKT